MERAGNIQVVKPKNNFEQVHKSIINNLDEVDCQTLGVYTRILVLGVTWSLNIKGLSKHLKMNDTNIRKSINILESLGFISRHAVRGDKGKFIGWNYILYPEPLEESKRTSAGKRTSQNTDSPLNGQDRQPCCPSAVLSENGEENNIKLNKQLNLINNKDLNTISSENSFSESNKKDKHKNKTFDVRHDLSYVDENMLSLWNEWLYYKDDINKQYKTDKGVKIAYNSLIKYSNSNVILAKAIIESAIEKSYQGFFPITDKQKEYFISNNSPYSENKKETANVNTNPTEKELRSNIANYPIGTISRCGRYKKITKNDIAEI